MTSRELGKLGEKIACLYLRKKGYQILARNYISSLASGPQRGEIDIIAQKNEIFHFIEVKSLIKKSQSFLIIPEFKVNWQKKRKIIKTAQEWFLEKKISFEKEWQVDIITVLIDQKTKKARICHFKNI